MLKQTGLLTLCISFIWARGNKNLLNSLKTSPHILYVQLPRCYGNKLCFIFIGPYSEAPIGVVWDVISGFYRHYNKAINELINFKKGNITLSEELYVKITN